MAGIPADLISGESVTVVRPVTGRDALGEPVEGEPERERVAGVLVTPGATADLDASRPAGASTSITLHFPKGYARRLRGCTVVVRGEPYVVEGDPVAYDPANTPGPWNLPVGARRADG